MRPMPRYILAFCVPLAATLVLTPLAARLAHRFDVLDHPVDHKTHRETTPYLGGLAVAVGLLLVAAFAGGRERRADDGAAGRARARGRRAGGRRPRPLAA